MPVKSCANSRPAAACGTFRVSSAQNRRNLLFSACILGAPLAEAADNPYDKYSATYDDLDNGIAADAFGLTSLRKVLLASAHGSVLECGVGTGINLPLYEYGRIERLTVLDLSRGMLAQAERKFGALHAGTPIQFIQGDVERLPFDDSTFDCVVDTFSMCVYPDPVQAMAEIARVVKPGGEVLLLEHSRSQNNALGWYQDLTAPAVKVMGKGCVWNQDLRDILARARLRPTFIQTELAGTISLIKAVPV